MNTPRARAALIYRIMGMLISIAGIILHLQSKHFVQSGFMIRHNLAYYTIQTNILAALLFAILIVLTLVRHRKDGRWTVAEIAPGLHGAAAFYITMTMLGFWLILAPTTGLGRNPYLLISSLILHTITPLLTIGDFLLFCPHGRLKKHHAGLWLSYPVIYLLSVIGYSRLIEEPYYSFQAGGQTIDLMYPYPFLDAEVLGTWGVLAAVLILAAIFYGLALLFIAVDKKVSPKSRP